MLGVTSSLEGRPSHVSGAYGVAGEKSGWQAAGLPSLLRFLSIGPFCNTLLHIGTRTEKTKENKLSFQWLKVPL